MDQLLSYSYTHTHNTHTTYNIDYELVGMKPHRTCHGYVILVENAASSDFVCEVLSQNKSLYQYCMEAQADLNYVDNDSCDKFASGETHFSKPWTQIYTLSTICFFGIILNSLVLLVSCTKNIWKSKATTLVASLALADLLQMLVNWPFNLYIVLNYGWSLGVVLCKLKHFFQVSLMSTVIATLAALSFERCSAITDPLGASLLRSFNSKVIAVALWMISALTGIPDFMVSTLVRAMNHRGKELQICALENSFFFWIPAIVYGLALVYISTSYFLLATFVIPKRTSQLPIGRQQNRTLQLQRYRVAKLVLFLVFLYVVCATPNIVYDIYLFFHPERFNSTIRFVFTDLMFLHSCVNPAALFCLSSAYRNAISSIFESVSTLKQKLLVDIRDKVLWRSKTKSSTSNNICDEEDAFKLRRLRYKKCHPKPVRPYMVLNRNLLLEENDTEQGCGLECAVGLPTTKRNQSTGNLRMLKSRQPESYIYIKKDFLSNDSHMRHKIESRNMKNLL